jgi:hypothetical protein
MKKIIACFVLFAVSLSGYCQLTILHPLNPGYHTLAPHKIVARFPASPDKGFKQDCDSIVSTMFHTKVYGDPNSIYSIAVINYKNITKLSDSLKELKLIVDYCINRMNGVNAIKISYKKSVFQNRTCYYTAYKAKAGWEDEGINDSLVSSDLYFFIDSFVVRAHVSTPAKNYPNTSITEFFSSINFNSWPSSSDPEAFSFVPVMPRFGKQENELGEYIEKMSKYAASTNKTGTKKPMYIKILIEKDGKVMSEEILKGINKEYDADMLHILKNMPAWSPGKLSNGDPVRVAMTFPVWFP